MKEYHVTGADGVVHLITGTGEIDASDNARDLGIVVCKMTEVTPKTEPAMLKAA